MIDVEFDIFSKIATVLRTQFAGIYVTGEYVRIPPSFPAVSIIEQDNSTYTRTLDTSNEENHATLMYEINVYSNKTSGKKIECKKIMHVIDAELFKMGFLRVGNTPLEVPNTEKSIYRIIARYRAVISKNKTIYRR